ncbi:MAG: tryptophan-rich sensory protein [Proteobacteria bacterium]|nr:tryptophan-rich sensory protein [Pseudomonadota bacterium]
MTAPSISPPPSRGLLAAGVSLAAALAVAGLGGWATASSVSTWYVGLHKPAFTPPNWLFGPVWTALYLLMALAAWRVWRAAGPVERRAPLGLYAAQLALNLAWSVLFFGLRRPDLALGEIALLLAAILATIYAFARIDRWAAGLMVPYAAWVAFASALNFEVWRLN